MAETGFEAERLEIEITEGVLMEDADAAVKFIRAFREMGVHVALDDFGTGYSSLSYLRRFPFDKLKVDQSFVRALGTGPGTSAIIHSVIALGRALGLTCMPRAWRRWSTTSSCAPRAATTCRASTSRGR